MSVLHIDYKRETLKLNPECFLSRRMNHIYCVNIPSFRKNIFGTCEYEAWKRAFEFLKRVYNGKH